MKHLLWATGISIVLICLSLPGWAQLSGKEKSLTIDSVISLLRSRYVFPSVAASIETTLRQNESAGKYDTLVTGPNLAFQLTRDLQEISKDLHLKVNYSPQTSPSTNTGSDNQQSWLKNLLTENHYGITEKKILPGNIGYLNLPLFGPMEFCADSIIAAMKTIENTDALILDLRSCRGSLDENTTPFFCSYFFREPVHLSDFYVRKTDFTKQFWTSAWVPGKKYLNKPVYILTSGRTFSGGEALAYDLQQLKRATILGEITRGGAHPTELYRLNNLFSISIPYARTINAVSKSNWEQTGVKPDSLVRSNMALYAAHISLLQTRLQKITDSITRKETEAAIAFVTANQPRFKTITFSLPGYQNAKEVAVAGSFNSFARKGLLLKREGLVWTGLAEVEAGEIVYAFIVDGKWITDPQNPATTQMNGTINSVLIVK